MVDENGPRSGRTSRRGTYSLLLLLFLAAYVGSYLGMSMGGAYMPANYGANGIKDWGWIPRGFASESGRFRVGFVIAFFPLYWVDSRYWHDDWTGLNGPQKMPIP